MTYELEQKQWAVVAHNAVYKSGLAYAEAFELAKAVKAAHGLSCVVVTTEAARRMHNPKLAASAR